MKTSCLRLKLVELNFFASFNADDQRKTYVSNVSKKKIQNIKLRNLKSIHNISQINDQIHSVPLVSIKDNQKFILILPISNLKYNSTIFK